MRPRRPDSVEETNLDRALWLLLGLQCRAWLRSAWRSLHTVKGVLLALVGLVVLGLWILSTLVSQSGGIDPDQLRRTAPAVFLTYCLFAALVFKTERGLYFSPAEVNLLCSSALLNSRAREKLPQLRVVVFWIRP